MKTLKTMLCGVVPAAVLALGSAMLSGCSRTEEAGRIVSIQGQRVTLETTQEGLRTHEVASDAKITLDGKHADAPPERREDPSVMLADLRQDDMLYEGEISQVGKDFVRVRLADAPAPMAVELAFAVTEETEILINGKAGVIEDLHDGLNVVIAAEQHGDLFLARRIAAGLTLL